MDRDRKDFLISLGKDLFNKCVENGKGDLDDTMSTFAEFELEHNLTTFEMYVVFWSYGEAKWSAGNEYEYDENSDTSDF
jgi:hypothetical protein